MVYRAKLLLLYIVLVADINKITWKTAMSNEEQHKKDKGWKKEDSSEKKKQMRV